MREDERKREKGDESIQTLRQLNPPAGARRPEQALLSFYMCILYIPQVLDAEN